MIEPSPVAGAVLALDATAASCGVAALRPDGSCVRRIEEMERGHAERLFPLIRDAMAEAGLKLSDIDTFAVAAGPGSFTGVRIGVAAARGLALAGGARPVGVDGFSAVAAQAQAAGLRAERAAVVFGKPPHLAARIFALREVDFIAADGDQPADLLRLAADPPEVVLGPAAAIAFPGLATPSFNVVDVEAVARLAARGGRGVGAPRPVYLRPPDAAPSSERRPTRLGPRPPAS